MARYVDVENFPKLFDEEYKKTRALIDQGETHLDNLAEGFLEADRVVRKMPTADVVPKSEIERLTVELEAMRTAANSYKMHYENLAKEIFEEIESIGGVCNGAFLFNTEIAELKKKYMEVDDGRKAD